MNTSEAVYSIGSDALSSYFRHGDELVIIFNRLVYRPGSLITPAPDKPFGLRVLHNVKHGEYVKSTVRLEAYDGYHWDFYWRHLQAGIIYYPYQEPEPEPEWVVECESPLEIRHKEDETSFATGRFAQFIIDNYNK